MDSEAVRTQHDRIGSLSRTLHYAAEPAGHAQACT